jgi:hypothetical protein
MATQPPRRLPAPCRRRAVGRRFRERLHLGAILEAVAAKRHLRQHEQIQIAALDAGPAHDRINAAAILGRLAELCIELHACHGNTNCSISPTGVDVR